MKPMFSITPKEQATDMFNKFHPLCGGTEPMQTENAKKACLICIEEIFDCGYPGFPSQRENDEWQGFWIGVKIEIWNIQASH